MQKWDKSFPYLALRNENVHNEYARYVNVSGIIRNKYNTGL